MVYALQSSELILRILGNAWMDKIK
jgi:hypothetical protein